MAKAIELEIKTLKDLKRELPHLPRQSLPLFNGYEVYTFEYPILIRDRVPYRLQLNKTGRSEEDARIDIWPIDQGIRDVNGDPIDISKFELVRWVKYAWRRSH